MTQESGHAPREETTPEGLRTLHDAEQLLIQACMERHGFRTWPTPYENPVADDTEFPYAVTDPEWAGRHGYGSDIQRRVGELMRSDPNRRYFGSLSPERRTAAVTALSGPRPVGLLAKLPGGSVVRRSSAGCVSEAERDLYGDLRTWYTVKKITDNLHGLRVKRVMADEEYERSVKDWSACMRKKGYPYATPGEARASALEAVVGGEGRGDEIRTAVAEARCAADSGLTGTARRLDERYERSISRQYRKEISTRRALEAAALPRATNALSEH
ncbi:hypothetical protein AB0M97_25410 [Streptomyces sp. NPDC051207]|uniref:hypothetical protein n=1 Tax=Streptomyces sp. NPDC051207 TaxID=3154641 RepID=UPI003444B49E